MKNICSWFCRLKIVQKRCSDAAKKVFISSSVTKLPLLLSPQLERVRRQYVSKLDLKGFLATLIIVNCIARYIEGTSPKCCI